MIDLKLQCPELLQQISGFPVDGTGTALPAILEETNILQKTLRAKLGLADGETTFEQSVSVNFESTFKESSNLIVSLIDSKDREGMKLFDNTLASGMKITRAISRQVATNAYIGSLGQAILSRDAESLGYALKKELPKFNPKDGIIGILRDPMLLVQNFYSEVKAMQNKSVGFTIDPLMFIRGCNSPNYSSCYTINRSYNSAAPISLGLSGYAGMIYSRDGNSVIGRCWVVFSPDFKSFCVMKSYGFLPDDVIDTVCGWLCTLLDNSATWLCSKVDAELRTSRNYTGVYGDPVYKAYSCSNEFVPFLPTPMSTCIICGKKHYRSVIMCDECYSLLSKCAICGNFMFKDPNHRIQLCSSCLKKKEVCPDCGSIIDAGTTCHCKNKENKCTFCDETAIITMNGISLCSSCAEILSTHNKCEVCGTEGAMYPYKKHTLCQSCFARVTVIEQRNREINDSVREKINAIRSEGR